MTAFFSETSHCPNIQKKGQHLFFLSVLQYPLLKFPSSPNVDIKANLL